MKISTKGRYALVVMIELAGNSNNEYIPLKDIAERQQISVKYLEKIVAMLNKAGFVQSNRGNNGGYKLAKEPKEYKVGDILPIEYYLTKFNAKVIGFAKSDSKVLLNWNMDEYLDRYMIIPQIDFDNPTNKTEYEFQKIVYLVRSNGYICVNNTTEDIQNMMLDIKLISEKTGFDKYLFIGYNPHLNQYNNLLSIIKENQNLIKTILSLITIFSIFILVLVILLQNKRRHPYFAIHYMQGSTLPQIILQQYLEIFIIFILAYITYFIILNNIFFIGNSKIHIILFLSIIFLNLILTIFSVKQIVANSIYKFLAVNETGEN